MKKVLYTTNLVTEAKGHCSVGEKSHVFAVEFIFETRVIISITKELKFPVCSTAFCTEDSQTKTDPNQ